MKNNDTIILISESGTNYEVNVKNCLTSDFLQKIYEEENENNRVAIVEFDYTDNLMEKLKSYLDYHEGKEVPPLDKPIRSNDMIKNCNCKWDAFFIDDVADSKQDLFNLALIAYKLNIKSLIDLCCVKIATLVKGYPLHIAVQNLK